MTMRIKTIQLKSFKGVDAIFALDPLNLLTGPNGSGKSAILQAIQWAIEGKTQLGGTLDASAQLFGAAGGEVTVELDDGFSWTRRLSVDHRDNKKSMQVIVAGNSPVAGKSDAEAVIVEHLGRGGELFAPMFDLRNFLDLSDDKRREFVLALCAKAGKAIKPTKVVEQIVREYLREELGEGTLGKKSNESATGELKESQRAALAQIRSAMTSTDKDELAALITRFAATVRDIALRSKKAHDEGRQGARQLSERLAELEIVADKVETLQAEAKKLDGQILDAEKQISHQGGLDVSIGHLEREVDELAIEIEHLEESAAVPHDSAELNALETELAALPTQFASPDIQAARGRFAELQTLLFAAQQQDSGWRTELRSLTEERKRLETEKGDCETNPWVAIKEKLSQIDTEIAGKIEGVALRLLAECRGLADSWSCGFLDKLAKCTARLDQLKVDIPEADEKLGTALADVQRHTAELAAAKNALMFAEAEHQNVDGQRQFAAIRRQEISHSIQGLKDRSAAALGHAARLGEAKTKRDATQAKLDELIASHGVTDTEEVRKLLELLTAEKDRVVEKLERKKGAEALAAEYAACLQKAEAEEALHDTAEGVRRAIRTVRETLMVELVQPLLSKMGTFLTAALGDTVEPYCRLENDRERPIFELGWKIGDRQIPEPALSGGEHCLFAAALAYALVELADPPLKLLMIEGAELDDKHLGNLLDAIGQSRFSGSAIMAQYSLDHSWGGWHFIDVSQKAVRA